MKIEKRFGKTLTVFVFVFAMVFSVGNVFAQENLDKSDESGGEDVKKNEKVEINPFQEKEYNKTIPTLQNAIKENSKEENSGDKNIDTNNKKIENSNKNNIKNTNKTLFSIFKNKKDIFAYIAIVFAIIPLIVMLFITIKKKLINKQ